VTLEYDGTRYHGWQEQVQARTVAGALRQAAESLFGGPVQVGGSGRTDAGVHALAQVAHLRVGQPHSPRSIQFGLNDRLPPDIHVLAVQPARADFDARRDARARSYLYQVATRRTAFLKRFVWWVKDPLELEPMQQAAAGLVGRHDFRHYCEQPRQQRSTIVVVESAELAAAGDLILFRIVASHFLWKMVRRVLGLLVAVGRGALTIEAAFGALDDRAPAPPLGHSAPPAGLFLERVLYPDSAPLEPLAPGLPLRSPPIP
jgi:tRNA pseudouridine38-40 synthase